MGGTAPKVTVEKNVQLWSYQTKERAAKAAYIASMLGITKSALIDQIVAEAIDIKWDGLTDDITARKLKALLQSLAITVSHK